MSDGDQMTDEQAELMLNRLYEIALEDRLDRERGSNSNPPRPFKAQRAGQCADGSPQCGHIQPGDLIIRLGTSAKFDMAGKGGYYELWYSHLKCYEEAERGRAEKAAKQEEQGE